MEEFATPDCDVLICDGNRKPLGTGVLLVPKDLGYVFILTVAHLFRNKNNPSVEETCLNIYSPFLRNIQYEKEKGDWGRISNVDCSIHTMGEDILEDESCIILLHSFYEPENEWSSYDLAVIKIEKEEWMDGMKPFLFPKEFKERISLYGLGYPEGTKIELIEKKYDIFSARMPFECKSATMDEHIPQFTVTHDYSESVNLKGYSGTGVFDPQGRLYGVVCRRVGNDEAPNSCIVSSWKGFEEILEVFGWKPPVDAAEESVFDIDLKVQGHWLLNCNRKSRGLMDDQKVVNLASLLLGMTDAYAVILATTWRNGIAHALEKMLNEYADRNHLERESLPFPKWREAQSPNYLAQVGEGVVVNIMASRQDIMPRIGELLGRYESVPLIVNIWSEKPAEALEATVSIYENSQLRNRADFISLIDYSAKLDIRAPRTTDAGNNYLKQLKCKEVKEKAASLLQYKDQDTGLWWNLIAECAGKKNAEENFIGYMIAQSSATAVHRWLSVLAEEDIERLFKYDTLYGLLEQDEIDDLAVHLWRYMRGISNHGYCAWEDCFQCVRECCSEHTIQLLDVLEGECEMNDSVDLFSPEDIRIWADLVKSTDFERNIGEIQRNQAFYWIAIMRNINGADYVIKERLKQQNQRFISKLLNRAPKKENDEFIENITNFIRKYIRAK